MRMSLLPSELWIGIATRGSVAGGSDPRSGFDDHAGFAARHEKVVPLGTQSGRRSACIAVSSDRRLGLRRCLPG